MNEHDLISVIVPVFNAEASLHACIESIIKQTYRQLQILLIDDGSVDKSADICDEYAKIDDRIIVFHSKNGGVSNARNLGIDSATGKYIAFIDSDDTVKQDYIEVLYNAIKENDSDLSVVYDFCDYIRDSFLLHPEKINNTYCFDSKKAIKAMLVSNYFSGHAWGKLLKRELLKDLRFDTSISFGEDLLFFVNYILNSSKICYVPEHLYNYTYNAESLSHGCLNEKKLTILKSIKKIRDLLQNRYGEEFDYFLCYDFLTVATDLLCMSQNNQKKERNEYFKEIKKDYSCFYNKKYLKFFNLKTKFKCRLMNRSIKAYYFLLKIKSAINKI